VEKVLIWVSFFAVDPFLTVKAYSQKVLVSALSLKASMPIIYNLDIDEISEKL
jgi:hypothetical protein